MDERIINNQVTISGEIIEEFEFSHEVYGEKFYTARVATQRLSGIEDLVPVLISEWLMDMNDKWTGIFVKIFGEYRSHNKYKKVIIAVFAQSVEILSEDNYCNQIFLDGYICKPPVYRKTPLGREIADLLIAVNRSYSKSDYIPCIAWGRNAKYARTFGIGEHIQVHGRIQSREYYKKISEDECEVRTAYEVSVSRIDVVVESEDSDDSED